MVDGSNDRKKQSSLTPLKDKNPAINPDKIHAKEIIKMKEK